MNDGTSKGLEPTSEVKELSPLEKEIQESGWQQKDTYFFSHDFTARNDPKCRTLMRKFGVAGYGIFWIIVEMLRAEPNYELAYSEITIATIAEECRIDEKGVDVIKELIDFCLEIGLLVSDETQSVFWSWSLKGRMIPIESKRKGSSLGGRNSRGKPKNRKKESTDLSTKLSPILEDEPENSGLRIVNSKQLDIEQLTVQQNEVTVPKLKEIKLESSLLKENPLIVSHAREEPSLLDKARDWVSKNVSDRPIAAGGTG